MPLGSVVLTERVPVDHVAEGDIVSFRSEGAETNTMHRVVEVETRGGTPVLTTKGDANVTIDPEKVTLDSPSVPVVRRVIPYAGTLVDHLRSPLGGVALFLLPIGGLLIDKPARKRDRTAKRRPGGSSHSLAGVSRLEELAVREATVDALLLQNKELLARVELVIARIERVERAPGRRLVSWVGRWTVRGA